jgi:hypothetical protein
MSKTFYSEIDIEDMARRGVRSLQLNDDVVLTALAYEKANKLGLKLLQDEQKPPEAPLRPYLSQQWRQNPAKAADNAYLQGSAPVGRLELQERILDAVNARLDGQVDQVLLQTLVQKVLNNVVLKQG